jgi:hypothetical protein
MILSEQASVGGRICRWLLLFQEYDFEVVVKPWKLNARPDHLSHILSGEDTRNLDVILSNAQLFAVKMVNDYFADIVQLLSIGMALLDMTIAQKKHLVVKATDYRLIAGNLYKLGADVILRRCVLENERPMILSEAHKTIARGHYAGKVTMQKILCTRL